MTRPVDNTTTERHAQTIDSLLTMIDRLETTLRAGEQIGTVQRDEAIATLETSWRDIHICPSTEKSSLMYVERSSGMRRPLGPVPRKAHDSLELWIAALLEDLREQHATTIDFLRKGRELVEQLRKCKVKLKWEQWR